MTADDRGLTAFGFLALDEMRKCGMILDISHMSVQSFKDAMRHYDGAVMATHSNAMSVCEFPRNLYDWQLRELKDRGAFVGVNLCPLFLKIENDPNISHILRHIEYLIKALGESNVGFGCDFDGVDSLPEGIYGVEDMGKIYHMTEFMGSSLRDDVFFNNGMEYLMKNLL